MQFKQNSLVEELRYAPLLLKIILRDADQYSQDRFGKELTITRILDPVKGESGVHTDYRGADCRNFFNGRANFSESEVNELCEYINKKYYRNDGFKTVIHHSFNDGPEHFHFQIAVNTKTYMLSK